MKNKQKIKLDCYYSRYVDYCTFNLKGEFISDSGYLKLDFLYSTQTKNNKWKCKKMYKIPEGFELISISKYDKLYLLSSNSIYEYSLITEKSIRIFNNDEKIEKVMKHIKIFAQTYLKIFYN